MGCHCTKTHGQVLQPPPACLSENTPRSESSSAEPEPVPSSPVVAASVRLLQASGSAHAELPPQPLAQRKAQPKAPPKPKGRKSSNQSSDEPEPEESLQPQPSQECELVEADYEIGQKLGEGTFGVVHECWLWNQHPRELRAVKYIDRSAQYLAVIMMECQLMQQLSSTNVVKCYKTYREPHYICVVMEKWMGCDVVSRLIDHTRRNERLSEGDVSCILQQMTASIQYIYSKTIVHRDVKMDNYLVDRFRLDDPQVRVALSDFGISIYCPYGEQLQEDCGTTLCKSPEFLMCEYAHKVDVWALGVMQVGLLQGQLPFNDERDILFNKPSFPTDVSHDCLDLMQKLLKKNERKRPSALEAYQHPYLGLERRSSLTQRSNRSLSAPVQDVMKQDNEGPRPSAILETKKMSVSEYLAQGSDPCVFEGYAWRSLQEMETTLLTGSSTLGGGSSSSSGGPAALAGCASAGLVQNVAWRHQVISEMLLKYKAAKDQERASTSTGSRQDLSRKTVQSVASFADELSRGASMLMLDRQRGKLMRMVQTVHVQIEAEIQMQNVRPDQRNRILVRVGRKKSPATVVATLPSTPLQPHESMQQAARRALEGLSLPGCEFIIEHAQRSWAEETIEAQTSSSLLQTVARHHTVPAVLRIVDERACQKAKVLSSASPSTVSNGDQLEWWTPSKCIEQGLPVQSAVMERTEVLSELVTRCGKSRYEHVPREFDEDTIASIMQDYGLRQPRPSALSRLAAELTKGEASLCEHSGRLVKVVQMVVMLAEGKIENQVIVEMPEVHATKVPEISESTESLPSAILRLGEDVFQAAYRAAEQCTPWSPELLRLQDGKVEIADKLLINAEGLPTLVRRHVVKATTKKAQRTTVHGKDGVAVEVKFDEPEVKAPLKQKAAEKHEAGEQPIVPPKSMVPRQRFGKPKAKAADKGKDKSPLEPPPPPAPPPAVNKRDSNNEGDRDKANNRKSSKKAPRDSKVGSQVGSIKLGKKMSRA